MIPQILNLPRGRIGGNTSAHQFGRGFGQDSIPVRAWCTDHGPQNGSQDLFTWLPTTRRPCGVPGVDAWLAVDGRARGRESHPARSPLDQRPVFRVNDQQIIPRLSCQAVLGAARLAVHVAILNLPNKAQVCRDPSQPVQPGSELGTGERLGTGTPFWHACTLSDYDSPRKQSKAFSRRSAYDT
jgi:hypothetical protein